jgi:hypothetical protein
MRLAYLALAGILSGGCIVSSSDDDGSGSTLTIENDSSFTIDEIRVTSVSSTDWGPNLVPEALLPGETVDISAPTCDHYDVMIVDETGAQCVLSSLDLCFNDKIWTIDDAELDSCAF